MEKLQHYSSELNNIPIDSELAPAPILKEIVEESALLTRRDERALAFHFLYAADQLDYQTSLERIVATFRSEYEISILDNSFAIDLGRAVIAQREELDALMIPFLKHWKLERLGCCTRLILRLALWELIQPDAIPSITINEAIELAKGFAEKDAYKFVNGILDEFVKSRQSVDEIQLVS